MGGAAEARRGKRARRGRGVSGIVCGPNHEGTAQGLANVISKKYAYTIILLQIYYDIFNNNVWMLKSGNIKIPSISEQQFI